MSLCCVFTTFPVQLVKIPEWNYQDHESVNQLWNTQPFFNSRIKHPLKQRLSFYDQGKAQLFLKDHIPSWLALGSYVSIVAISTSIVAQFSISSNGTMPWSSTPLRMYNSFLKCIWMWTYWSLDWTSGKLAVFEIGA